MVGCETGVGFQPRFRGWRMDYMGHDDGGTWRGIHQPLKRGWITLSPSRILPCYGRLFLHQPLNGVDPPPAWGQRKGKRSIAPYDRRLCASRAVVVGGKGHTGESIPPSPACGGGGLGGWGLIRLHLCMPAPLTLRRTNTRITPYASHPPQPPLCWRRVDGCRGLCFFFLRTLFPAGYTNP